MLRKFRLYLKYGFRPNKPLLFARLAGDLFKRAFLRRVPLRYVDIALDYKCNLHCRHCFVESLTRPDKGKLSLDEYKRIAKELFDLGVLHFSFQGGEVFLDPQRLDEVIRAFSPEKSLISITTNATLLEKEIILGLQKLKVDILNISLDSMDAAEHDGFRNRDGVFKKAMSVVEDARRLGMPVTINTVASKDNIDTRGFQELIKWAKGNRLILNIILASPTGGWAGNLDIMVTDEQIKKIKRLKSESIYIRQDMDANFLGFGCPAAKEVLYITPYGDVLPCPYIHISLGNVREEPLEDIRGRGLQYSFFRDYSQKCLACEDRDFIRKYIAPTFYARPLPLHYKILQE